MSLISAYIRFLHRFRWPLALVFIAIFAASIERASHLKLKSDFKTLLPSNFQSVRDLDRIVERVGGTGSLVIAVECDDPNASMRFADDLVARLKQYPPGFINRIDYNISATKKFFEDNKYLYMKLDDLQEVHDRLERRIHREKLKHSGLYIDLETPQESGSTFDTKDIEDKYKGKTGQYDTYINGYFFGENGRLLAIVLRPPGSSTGIDFSKKLITRLNNTIAELSPTAYHPSMRIGFSGNVLRAQFEYQALIDDIVSTALLCVGLVALVVFIYYRRLRMVMLMGWTTVCGVAWAFAIAQWQIGYLTTQTAFLGSIILGNGINYGLILLSRYLEERKAGHSPLPALQISIPATFTGTLASSLNTSVAFATLMLTQVRGFSQFGFIGALGMVGCWIATYTVLPVFLSITEQIWPTVKKVHREQRLFFSPMSLLAKYLPALAKPATIVGLVMTLISIPLIIHFIPNSLEYNFSKLRVKARGKEMSEEATLGARIRTILGSSATPATLVTDRLDQVEPLCKEIMRKNELDPPEKRLIDNCKTLYSYVPPDQEKKLAILADMRRLLEDSTLDFLSPKQKEEVENFKAQFKGKSVTASDLPDSIVSNFREKNGEVGKIVYVYPAPNVSLWDKKTLFHFTDMIRQNSLPSGETLYASGDTVIFADLIREVMHDGPKATVMAFVAVCLIIALTYWRLRAIMFIIGTLVFGVLWMGGLIALFKIKINFFNFIAIPTTFGIGIDYGINIYQRYRLEGAGSLSKVLRTTGGAVALCSLTTIIGYFTLIIAKNQALVSFGWIGIIGEITCLVAALLFVPALITYLDHRRSRQGLAST